MTRATTLTIVLACLGAAPPAYAHFVLLQPASWAVQASTGDPEKSPPCGNEGPPVATGAVTEYRVGETVTIKIDERTPHPGHYRVSLAADQASFPDDPMVTPGATPCGSLAINNNPTLPLLADGLLVHTRAFTAPQTAQVTLPAGMMCDHCVLQIVEFMSNHDAPCFYHHCANIKITATGADAGPPGPTGDAGNDPTGDAGNPNNGVGGGCCDTHGRNSPGLLGLVVGALALRRRRCS